MKLKDHDLKQIDEDYLGVLPPDKLVEVSLKLLADLKEARDRLNQTPQNSSRPSGNCAPWEGGLVANDSPVEEAPNKEAETEEKKKKKERDQKQSKAGPGKKKTGQTKRGEGTRA